MQATLRRAGPHQPPLSVDVIWKTLAAFAGVIAIIAGVLVLRGDPPKAIDGRSATVWLSGETKGRVVLAAARAQRPSIGVTLPGASGPFDIADLGRTVLVHDRSSGMLTELDGVSGTERDVEAAATPVSDRSMLVAAGSVGYFVDRAEQTVQRINRDGTKEAPRQLKAGFTDWVGTTDGQLWTINADQGTFGSYNGETESSSIFADAGGRYLFSAIGADPVVVDLTSSRVRWLRRDTSVEVPGLTPASIAAGRVAAMGSDPEATCIVVAADTLLSCVGPIAVARSVALHADFTFVGVQLFANRENVLATWPGSTRVTALTWVGGAIHEFIRSEPSARVLVGSSATGPIVVDDPGSAFAFTVDHSTFVELDKFSKRTVVISSDGTGADGVGAIDANADIAGVFVGGDVKAPPPNNDGKNDPPVARPDRIVTRVGRSVPINVLANDVDPDGDALAVVDAGPISVSDGVVTVIKGARVSYQTPASSRDREISFPYTIQDTSGVQSSSTVTVELVGSDRNTPPKAVDDEAKTVVNVAIDVAVLDNDTDAEGDALTITEIDQPAHGTAGIGEDQKIRYEPKPGFVGSDSITYKVVDGYDGETTAKLTVRVEAASTTNQPPVAQNDRIATQLRKTVQINVLNNDSDPDGDALKIVEVSKLPGVELTIIAGQTISATPSSSVVGLVSFTYSVEDTGGLRATATVALVVEAPVVAARPPTALDDAANSSGVAIPIDVLVNDSDPGGGQLAINGFTQPTDRSGSVSKISGRTLQFTPSADFTGSSRFNYSIINGDGLTATATVTVQVSARTGSGPVARDDSKTVFVGEPIVLFPLANDSHPDSIAFSYAGSPVVRSGSAVVNADGSLMFTPPNAEPGVFVLTYTIQDRYLARSSADITITVLPRPVTNHAPTPLDDLASTPFQTATVVPVLDNDTDPDGDVVQLVGVGNPPSGTAVISSGRIRFTPANGSSGLVTFSYTVQDPDGLSATAKMTVQISDRVRVAPIANQDLVTLITGETTSVNPLSNDSDPDGAQAELSVTDLGSAVPTGGATATRNGNSVAIAAGGKVGTFDFTYAIKDADGLTSSSTIAVVVQAPPNAPPVATPDSATILGLPSTINVLSNDTDPDGGAITLVSVGAVSPAAAGSATINGTSIQFVPTAGWSGTVTFQYTIRDPQNSTGSATVTITVTACPAAPNLTPQTVYTAANTTKSISLFGDGPVPAGTIAITPPTAGTATLNGAKNTVTYTPPAGYSGVATMTYSVTTSCNNIATALISITVNRPPVAVNDFIETPRNTAVVVPVLANDTDPDNDALVVFQLGTFSAGGTAVIANDGSVVFTPDNGFVGTATFRYNIRDAGGASDNGKVTVTVTFANGAPVANPDQRTIPTGSGPVTIDVLSNDTDPNGDTLRLDSIGTLTPPEKGTANVNGNVVLFIPAANAAPGQVTITYVVSDGIATATGTITVTIVNRPPVAVSDVGSLDSSAKSSVTVDVVQNDSDPEGGQLTMTVAAQPGVTAAGRNISYTFKRPEDFSGPVTVLITYTITDPLGASATGQLTITVT